MGHAVASKQIGFQARDEGQTGRDDFVETAVVGEEEIDACGGGDGEMQGVERFHSVVGTQFGEEADGLWGVSEHRDGIRVEELLDGGGGSVVVCFDGADEEFAEDEEAAAEGIGPLQHGLMDLLNALA